MDLNRIRELAGVISDRLCLSEGDEVGKTIAQQMGGPGRLRAMLGAKQIVLLPNGLKIKWPNKERSKGNVCVITLRSDDTYDMEFLNGEKSVKKYEGVYNDALISTFETHTGWFLSLGTSRAGTSTSPVLRLTPAAKESVGEGRSTPTMTSRGMSYDEPSMDSPPEDERGDEPEEDDIVTTDHRRWYQSGKIYVTGDEKALRRKMDKDKFWPNVWFISDHGNAHRMTLEQTEAVVPSRADMETALWKWWPPDARSMTDGKKQVMFTGSMARAAEVLNYTTMPLSELTDKTLKACFGQLPAKESVDEAKKSKSASGGWDGREVSIGTSAPPHAVTPRLLGKQADKFKKMMGVCPEDGCAKIQGHPGSHTATKESVAEASQTYAQAQQDILAGLAKEGWTVKTGLKIPQAISPDSSWKLFFKAQAIYLGQGAKADLGNARSLHLNDIRGGTYEKFKADLARWTKAESVEVASEFRERAGLAGAHADWTLSEGVETFAGIWRRKHIGDESVRVTFEREANKHGIPGVRWSISTDGGLLGSADEAGMKDLAKGTAVRMRDGSLSFEGDGLKKFKAWQGAAVQTSKKG